MIRARPQYPSPEETFRGLCVQFSELLALDGVRARPFVSEELPHFAALDPARQAAAIARLSEALSIHAEVRSEHGTMLESARLMWRAMSRMKLRPEADFFDKVGEEDVLILYSPQYVQLFQDVRFWNWVNITVEDVYAESVFDYSKRDPEIQKRLIGIAEQILSGKASGTVPGVEEHLVEEVGTVELSRMLLTVPWLAPVYRGSEIAGVISMNRFRSPEAEVSVSTSRG